MKYKATHEQNCNGVQTWHGASLAQTDETQNTVKCQYSDHQNKENTAHS
jgi:hypothetical protein